MNRELIVALEARSYPVWFRRGAGPELVDALVAAATTQRIVVVTDVIVGPLHADAVAAAVKERGIAVCLVHLELGEVNKTFAAVQRIYDAALAFGIDRSTPVVGFGGGIVGDLAGFAAATLLRGLPFLQVPTTLLAQVDSSVGGKTGFNHGGGKNLVGAFHQPDWVFVDLAWLETLPARQLRAGLAEVIKHGALSSPDLLGRVERGAARWLAGDLTGLDEVVAEAVAIKAAVVAEDEREHGVRATLNLGHTLGHAIEATAPETWLHGEAVALGLAFAAELSRLRAGLSDDETDRLLAALEGCGLPITWRDWVQPEVLGRLALDKKTRGKRVNYILLERLGRARIDAISTDELRDQVVALARTVALR